MNAEGMRQFLTAQREKPLVLGLIVFLLLATILAMISSINSAYAVMIDGELAALVADEMEAEEAISQLLEDKMKETGQTVKAVQQVEIMKTKAKGERLSGLELIAVLNNHLDFTTAGVAILINGKQKLIVENQQVADQLIKEAKNYYLSQDDKLQVVSTEFAEEINFEMVEIGIGKFTDYETAFNLLVNGTEKVEKHIVASGESLWTIARDNNMWVEDLQMANPQLDSERLQIGQELNLVKLEPAVNVHATLKHTTTEKIPFQTKYVNDSKVYRGQQKVTQAGERGEREVVYQLVQVNGVTVEKEELEAKVVKKPTEQIIAKGTKVIVASRGSGEAGKLGWPVSGRITSGYGSRSGSFHSGIDISAPAGTSIRATNAGVVTFSAYNGNYGRMIDIDHGNGVSTRYAHNSANLVTVGQQVKAGEIIGRVGSTGRSTGPHVHFEVRVNGQVRNPMNYLP